MNKINALASFLNTDKGIDLKNDIFIFENKVLTNKEAFKEFDTEIDSLIEQGVFEEIPKIYHNYFDKDLYRDTILFEDGRGIIAKYDNQEIEYFYNNETFYIYRIN